MTKTILLTGATDGIGLETAKMLRADGHSLLLHGRNAAKMDAVMADLATQPGAGTMTSYLADMSDLNDVSRMADAISAEHERIDVLINNAGIFKTATPIGTNGLDVRFSVNTHAPYLLTKRLLSHMPKDGRVLNLASAAQAPVDLTALDGRTQIANDFAAYAQSKLAIIIWTRHLAAQLGRDAPQIIAVNPGSLLGTKMVRDGFGTAGNDISIGAKILCRAALSEAFDDVSGQYFDNDSGRFAPPHPAALDDVACAELVASIEATLAEHLH